VLGETHDGEQQPEQDHEDPEVCSSTNHVRTAAELGNHEAEPGERDSGPDLGEQRAIARKKISHPRAVVCIHQLSSSTSAGPLARGRCTEIRLLPPWLLRVAGSSRDDRCEVPDPVDLVPREQPAAERVEVQPFVGVFWREGNRNRG
jgi:hypothetical protein